jgi:hypothetical protein
MDCFAEPATGLDPVARNDELHRSRDAIASGSFFKRYEIFRLNE